MPYRDPDERRSRNNETKLATLRLDRDIAPGYPPPGDLAAREACESDLRRFCDTYFPAAFSLPWCPDHLKVIARLEEVMTRGGLFALAMPRGFGKTALSVRAALWALLYGHRRFVCLVAATEERAKDLLKHVKTELVFNDRLGADFRQVCYPLQRLENNGRKCIGQLFAGAQTRIEWGSDRLTFPTMPPEACDGADVSGSCVTVAGLTGALRGQSHTLLDGTILRPEVVILDDPQTRESAQSPNQNERRAAIIQGDVLGMAGPGRSIAAIMPCTVIRAGDMAAELLDRKKHPDWCGQRTRMVYSFPANEALWEEYARLRADGLEAERGTAEATEFYRERRAAMDAGAVVAWPENYEQGELSALQHAQNLRFRDPAAFFAEYQNEPLPEDQGRRDDLTPEQVAAKVNRLRRGAAYLACSRVTAFIDVHATVLYYCVCGWENDFTGYVLDYGTYPDQKRPYFSLYEVRHTLARAVPGAGREGQIYGGLEALTASLLGREWRRDDGAGLTVERCLIDANWGETTAVVKRFCRQSAHAAVLTPSHGRFVRATARPIAEWPLRPGERAGDNWRLRGAERHTAVRALTWDVNYWKSFVAARLMTALGDRGCLSLFGDNPEAHRLFADHCTAEYRKPATSDSRTVDEWHLRPGRDNHYWDTLNGCAVAASLQGVALAESSAAPAPARKRVSFAELQRRGRN